MSLRCEQWHDWLHPYNPCSLQMFIIVFEENKKKPFCPEYGNRTKGMKKRGKSCLET